MAVLLVLLGASSTSRPAEASVMEGDVVLIERVDPAAATRLFASSDAVLYLPEEGSAYLLLPSGEEASGGRVVARRVLPGEMGRRFRPSGGRPYLIKEPASLEAALTSRLPAALEVAQASSAVPFVEGFENGLAAWERADNTGGLYRWGTTTCSARSGRYSADAIRGGLVSPTCGEPYPSSLVTELMHASCESLGGTSRSYLDFYLYAETETSYDSIGFYYQDAGGTWRGYRFSGSWSAWFHLILNLKQWYSIGDVTALPCPKLLIDFESDESTEPGFGVRIDDLTIGSENPSFLNCAIQATPTSGAAPLSVSFTPVVSGASASAEYLWSFGDAAGTTSTSRTPTFRYDTPGDYTARLRVADSGVRAYANQAIHVTQAGPPCSIACSASAPATATAGTAVSFSGSATATACASAPATQWSFGDGATSTLASPTHTYATAGTYPWTFTASADGQVCSKSGSITVSPVVSAGATVTAGTMSGLAGGNISLPLTFSAGGAEVTAVSVDLSLGSSLSFLSASSGAAASAAGKQIAAASRTGAVRLVVYGMNQTRLADGALASVALAIRPGTPAGTLPVTLSASGSDALARAVAVQGKPGSVKAGSGDSQGLTLARNRVLVTVDWQNPYSGEQGTAYALPQDDKFGFFYYTDPNNPEVFVKVLDFGSGSALCFVGGLTDFSYKVTFTMLRTGQAVTFEKPPYQFIGYVNATDLKFAGAAGTPEASSAGASGMTFVGALAVEEGSAAAGTAPMAHAAGAQREPQAAAPQSLSFSSGRVAVTIDWRNPYSGETGRAYGIPKADPFGFFYYTDPNNPEVFVKVLDFGAGSALVFVGGLTDFYYKVTFRVVRTGQTLVFEKPEYKYIGYVQNGELKF